MQNLKCWLMVWRYRRWIFWSDYMPESSRSMRFSSHVDEKHSQKINPGWKAGCGTRSTNNSIRWNWYWFGWQLWALSFARRIICRCFDENFFHIHQYSLIVRNFKQLGCYLGRKLWTAENKASEEVWGIGNRYEKT